MKVMCLSAVLTLIGASCLSAIGEVIDDGLLITHVSIISPERLEPVPNSTVVIRSDRIAQVGTDLRAGPHARTIDGHEHFLIPGLIDSHVHIGNMGPLDDAAIEAHPDLLQAYRTQLPRSYLAFGFTTIIDLDLRPETASWFNASPNHPNLCSCGRGVRIVGGYMALTPPQNAAAANSANIVYETNRRDWPSNLDPHDYTPAHAVARAAESNAICLKTFIEPGFGGAAHWPVPEPQTLATLRTEAKKRGLVFVIHANALESWRAALTARPDVIAHGLWHWPGDRLSTNPPREVRDAIRRAARTHVWIQPTLQCTYGDLSIFDKSLMNDHRLGEALPGSVIRYLKNEEGQKAQKAQSDEYRQAIAHFFSSDSIDPLKAMSVGAARAMSTLQLMLKEHAKLLFGTDTPSNEGIGNPPGLNGRFELGHWAEAGVPLAEILRAATIDNARAFGLSSDRGTIEPGKRADLLLLRANPLKTITAYDTIDTVITNGNPISRSALLPVE